ncbi:hypothetical protein [Aquabacterium sp.]|uniref:hypothetical protein n=1 Tax=Aquabacterium sp. TaxID=1872578 RepID=UPI0025C0B92D|nr:hypothetical protein [Aquabacterium sp.]
MSMQDGHLAYASLAQLVRDGPEQKIGPPHAHISFFRMFEIHIIQITVIPDEQYFRQSHNHPFLILIINTRTKQPHRTGAHPHTPQRKQAANSGTHARKHSHTRKKAHQVSNSPGIEMPIAKRTEDQQISRRKPISRNLVY